MNERIEDEGSALTALSRTVLLAVADRRIDEDELAGIEQALAVCDGAHRAVSLDGQHVSAAFSMIGTLARTHELTPKVVRKLHETERDLLSVEASNVTYVHNLSDLFPAQAA